MNRFKLKNGLKIIELKRKSDIVTIQITINVGSNNETPNIAGISHFIEHMVFEGTKHKSPEKVANSIESLGGELSAYTSNEITCFYIKIIKKHFDKALEILSEIIINPLFDKKLIEKERDIILSEVKMVKDQPRHHQWTLFYQTLYDHFPAKNPIYGTEKAVKTITREDIINYFKKYYTSQNMVISVVGDIPQLKERAEKYFSKMNDKLVIDKFNEENKNRKKVKKEKKKIHQSYCVLGYKVPKRNEYDSYIFDVIKAILGRGLSGKLFRIIRIKHGLAYEVGVHNDANIHYGAFTAYFSTDKKNIKKCVDLTLEEFKKLRKITTKELLEAKQYLEGESILSKEDSQKFASSIGEWEFSSKAEDALDYIQKIKKVSKKDIIRVTNKYLNEKYSLAIIEQC
jgi:predicted Zn-dependent peptidase